MNIYTRKGDTGETGLFGGTRVTKNHPRVAAYGAGDELNAVLGSAAATHPTEMERDLLSGLQRDLFAIGAQLAATDTPKLLARLPKAALAEGRIGEMEAAIDRLDSTLPALDSFILPGGTPKAAAFHLARTACRRAEREVVRLSESAELPPAILPYLNRLSDLLFVLARYANRLEQQPDLEW